MKGLLPVLAGDRCLTPAPDSRRRAGVARWFAAGLVVAALNGAAVAEAKVTLVFGSYSPDKPSAMVAQLRPTLDRIAANMSALLGEEVEIDLKIVRGYGDGVDMIVDGSVDFMRLGPASYVKAKDLNPGIQILAMEQKDGKNSFNGVICVHSDSDITDVSQLRGRSFAFGSSDSTLGRYFSQLYLLRNGIYARDLSRYEYLGRHDKVGRAVGAKTFDAGALEETTFAKLVESDVPIRAIATFRNATRPWVARAGMDPRLETSLRGALLQITEPSALKALRFDGFLPGDDAEYQPTREAIAQNQRFFDQVSRKP